MNAPIIPKCIFCGADWDKPMVEILDFSEGCDSCNHGAYVKTRIQVHCGSCERLVYEKEATSDPYG